MTGRIWIPVSALICASLAVASWLFLFSFGNAQKLRTVDTAIAITGGSPDEGARVISAVGCGGCHTIPGIPGAHGKVAAPLSDFRERAMIAGVLANSAENLKRWIQHPREVEPKTAMPDLGLTEQQARDAAAYLYAPSTR